MTFEEAMAHAGYHSICEVEDRAKQMMPHYLFMEGDEKHREGFCTACEKWVDCSKEAMKGQPVWVQQDPYLEDCDDEPEFIPNRANYYEVDFQRHCTGRAMHNATGYCPQCGERVTFKHAGRGYRTLQDRRFLIRWHKSRQDKHTLVCLGYDVVIPWRGLDLYHPEVPISATLREICVIPWGKRGERFIYEVKWCGVGGYDWTWQKRSQIRSGWRPGATMFGAGPGVILDNRRFMEAISQTPWEKVLESRELWHSEAADWRDRIELMSRVSRLPCLEYMVKLGFDQLARELIDRRCGNLVNPRGKTAKAVLKLTDDEWGEVKGKHLNVTKNVLELRKLCRERHIRLNMEALCWMGEYHTFIVTQDILGMEDVDLAKGVKYCMRRKVYLYEWRDQLRMMIELGMDIRDQEWLYPKDFRRSHGILAERVNVIRWERMEKAENQRQQENNRLITQRLEGGELDEYFFSARGLVLRPMLSAGEIIKEGSAQNHCVGGYVNTYAKGNDVLCVLRYEDKPTVPLYTVEFGKDGRLVQCRAYRNQEGPISREEREAFWKLHDMMRKDLRAQKAREAKRRKSA